MPGNQSAPITSSHATTFGQEFQQLHLATPSQLTTTATFTLPDPTRHRNAASDKPAADAPSTSLMDGSLPAGSSRDGHTYFADGSYYKRSNLVWLLHRFGKDGWTVSQIHELLDRRATDGLNKVSSHSLSKFLKQYKQNPEKFGPGEKPAWADESFPYEKPTTRHATTWERIRLDQLHRQHPEVEDVEEFVRLALDQNLVSADISAADQQLSKEATVRQFVLEAKTRNWEKMPQHRAKVSKKPEPDTAESQSLAGRRIANPKGFSTDPLVRARCNRIVDRGIETDATLPRIAAAIRKSFPDLWFRNEAVSDVVRYRKVNRGELQATALPYDGTEDILPDLPVPGHADIKQIRDAVRNSKFTPTEFKNFAVTWLPGIDATLAFNWFISAATMDNNRLPEPAPTVVATPTRHTTTPATDGGRSASTAQSPIKLVIRNVRSTIDALEAQTDTPINAPKRPAELSVSPDVDATAAKRLHTEINQPLSTAQGRNVALIRNYRDQLNWVLNNMPDGASGPEVHHYLQHIGHPLANVPADMITAHIHEFKKHPELYGEQEELDGAWETYVRERALATNGEHEGSYV